MKIISVFAVLSVLLLTVCTFGAPASSSVRLSKGERDEVVGLFGTLLAPSIFTTASSEKLSASIYGRTLTGEGKVPDFDGSVKDNIDSLQVFINGRLGDLGATIGFGQGNEFEFSQPLILSVDYKVGLLGGVPVVDAAIDAQYSMIYLPDEENIKVSAPGYGVVSLNGIVSADLLFLLEPYAGLTLNYVYLNSEEEFISVWKPVPKIGAKIKLLPFVSVGTEVIFIINEHLNSAWMWNFGASARF